MDDATLLDVWPLGSGPAVSRFLHLFRKLSASETADSLGMFNRRIARLHQDLFATAPEAKVTCACGEELEVALPIAAIAAAPDPLDVVEIDIGSRRRFRLPRVDEMALADDPVALADLCALDDGAPVQPSHLPVLDAAWADADPAADIVLDLSCPACGGQIVAHAELALFVARDLDLKARGLVAEIHRFAQHYGWSERDVLAIPPGRRQAYANMIGGQA